jgi:hypothetical protein
MKPAIRADIIPDPVWRTFPIWISPISAGLILDLPMHALNNGASKSSGDVLAKAPLFAFVKAVRTAQQMTTSSPPFTPTREDVLELAFK